MMAICEEGMCAGCMACQVVCPKAAVSVNPGVQCYDVMVDGRLCIDCGRCATVCQQRNPAQALEPLEWWQGWAIDAQERATSSSGGAASAIMRGFVQGGGVIVACRFAEGRFGFAAVEDAADVDGFKGSKYVKSDPTEAYGLVRSAIDLGRDALFVGLPCQVSAMRNYIGPRRAERLYTIDLICHGSPSPQVLEQFLRERGIAIEELESIGFRKKARFGLREGSHVLDTPGVLDKYTIGFLAGLTYTENCYSCAYACTARVSDITLGDSWGSDLLDEVPSGVSLILCMTDKGRELLGKEKLILRKVDVDTAIANNAQLRAPSAMPKSRSRFIANQQKGQSVSRNIARCLPKQCLKQDVKRILVKAGLLKLKRG